MDALEREAPEDGDDARTLPVEVGAWRRRRGALLSTVLFTCGHDTEDVSGANEEVA